MSKLTVSQAREMGRQIVGRHPEGISYSAIVAEIKEAHPTTPHGTVTGAVWNLDRTFPGEIVKPQRGLFMPIGLLALAEMTSAAARAGAREADIAKVTGLSEATVRRKLEEAHGKKLVHNVFEEHWPKEHENGGAEEDDEVADVNMLGEMTSAAARGEGRESDIVKVTGLSEATVRRRMEQAHGKKLVRNVFVDHWPSHDEEEGVEDIDTLGGMSSAAARDEGRSADIAKVTGLSESVVRRRLDGAYHRKLVRNVFVDHWPSHDEEAIEDVDGLGAMPSATARDEGRAADIAKVTGLSVSMVTRRLEAAHHRKIVRNVFVDHWPSHDEDEEVNVDALGGMNSAAAREDGREADIAKVTGLSVAVVRRRLEEAHHRKLVCNVFEEDWPSHAEAEDEEEIDDVDALGRLRAAEARDEGREVEIARVTGLSVAVVRRRLEEAHHRKRVSNVFEDRWPNCTDEVEALEDVDALGRLRAAEARDEGREAEIARVTGLSVPAVRRNLEEAHHRKRVSNVFEEHWPSHDEDDEEDAADADEPEATSSAAMRADGRGRGSAHIKKSKEVEKGEPPRATPIPATQVDAVKPSRAEAGQPVGATSDVKARSPRIPKPILTAYATGKLAIFCGSGLSLGSDVKGRLPSWNQLPVRLLDACAEYATLDEEAVEAKKRRFQFRMSLEQMLSELGSLKTDLKRHYQTALNEIFRPDDATPGAAHRAIAKLGVRAVLTTNYDQLIESVHETPRRQVYTWKEAAHALEDLKARRKVLLKVHGTAERHDTVVMSENEYGIARSNKSYQSVLSYLLQEHMFLFVGYGMNDPLDLDLALKYNADAFRNVAQQHFVLLFKPSDADRDRYEREYNVHVIPYSSHDEVPVFLEQLAATRQ